ncbi:hypothetical protein BIFBRE_03439 [Bifidobacterium breve DSM 20213 = JCM 1192]|uniref:Pantothenate kinase n=1 Tax=Bifidobacterium breve DSM 20213 = JCM 1192 TaxID=518634 RepID=D4BMZ2_BIFBR|nr:hypothetical protein BIFBRE_03439 [Bifidobacterium breve DSM 20213 = JCM 1192]
MLVAVDIGNTNIVLGFLDGDTIAGPTASPPKPTIHPMNTACF